MTISAHGQVVGALACQKNSYLRSLEARVVDCTKEHAQPGQRTSKKKAQAAVQDSWLIEFSDSVLFPEGETGLSALILVVVLSLYWLRLVSCYLLRRIQVVVSPVTMGLLSRCLSRQEGRS